MPEKDALDLTFNAIKDGASGVDMVEIFGNRIILSK